MTNEPLPNYVERLGRQNRREEHEAKDLQKLQAAHKDHISMSALQEYERFKERIHDRVATTKDTLQELRPYEEVAESDYAVSQGSCSATIAYGKVGAGEPSPTLTVTFAQSDTALGLPPPEQNSFLPVILSPDGPILWAPDEPQEWPKDHTELTTNQLVEWLLIRLTDYSLDVKKMMADRSD